MTVKTSTSNYKPGMDIKYVQEKYGLKNVIKLASNENPCGPSKKAVILFVKHGKKQILLKFAKLKIVG